MPAEKRARGGCNGQQPPRSTTDPPVVTVATIKSKATVRMGEVGNTTVEVMFDSGSAVSLLQKSDTNRMSSVQHVHKQPRVRLITAAGEPLPVVGIVQVPVQVGNFKTTHDFLVVDYLIYQE